MISKILLIILITTNCILAQKKCDYNINTPKILSNESLDKFIYLLQKNDFIVSNNKKEIPSFIKKQLDCISGEFSIANPGEKYQSNCIAESNLPKRKLIFLSKSKNVLVMTYLIGGFAVSSHILLIEFDNQKILDLWTGPCLNKLNSNKEIILYIQESQKKGIPLNSKKVSL